MMPFLKWQFTVKIGILFLEFFDTEYFICCCKTTQFIISNEFLVGTSHKGSLEFIFNFVVFVIFGYILIHYNAYSNVTLL